MAMKELPGLHDERHHLVTSGDDNPAQGAQVQVTRWMESGPTRHGGEWFRRLAGVMAAVPGVFFILASFGGRKHRSLNRAATEEP